MATYKIDGHYLVFISHINLRLGDARLTRGYSKGVTDRAGLGEDAHIEAQGRPIIIFKNFFSETLIA